MREVDGELSIPIYRTEFTVPCLSLTSAKHIFDVISPFVNRHDILFDHQYGLIRKKRHSEPARGFLVCPKFWAKNKNKQVLYCRRIAFGDTFTFARLRMRIAPDASAFVGDRILGEQYQACCESVKAFSKVAAREYAPDHL